MKNPLKVVVTGEVDSGKSTLIGRLLYEAGALALGVMESIKHSCARSGQEFEFAYILDSFEEERNDAMTIDSTQVFCKAKGGNEFIFIDVPGHRELLKNMLCGSSYADIAVLVIDARKSIEEQTRQHAFILKFLGIERIIVALNKMDLVDFDEDLFTGIRDEIGVFFEKCKIQSYYFIPVSANNGYNLLKNTQKMPWYKGPALFETLKFAGHKEYGDDFYFPVQDIYRVDNEDVLVGKIVSGRIRKGEEVNIFPLGETARIKEIRDFKNNKPAAMFPESVGIVPDRRFPFKRGQVICKGSRLPQPGKNIDARIYCVSALATNEIFEFNCATQSSPARITVIKGSWESSDLKEASREEILEQDDFAEVALTCDNSVVVNSLKEYNALGRFVLRLRNEICAIGIIL